MIEDQFAPMPPGQSGHYGSQHRQQQTMRQHRIGDIKAKAEIGPGDGDQRHRGNGMVPARDAHPDTGHGQQFERTDNRRKHAEGKGETRRPQASPYEEWVCREPIQHVDAQRRDDQRYGKMHKHGMDGVTGNGNGRADILIGHGPNGGIGMARMGLGRRFLALDFTLFAIPLGHAGSRVVKVAALAATPVVLSGCATPLSTLDPAGPAASNIATLWWVMFWGSVVLFALVLALLAISLLRPRWIAEIKPMHWIIGGGLVLPVPILVGLLIAALVLGERLLPLPGADAPMRIEAKASQWQWRFAYPDMQGSTETDVLHLPAGEPVDIVVTAEDVIHSFWIPRIGGKIDAIPGRENTIRLEADRPGTYRGICAEYCGEGHETMGFVVEAHARGDYSNALETTP